MSNKSFLFVFDNKITVYCVYLMFFFIKYLWQSFKKLKNYIEYFITVWWVIIKDDAIIF